MRKSEKLKFFLKRNKDTWYLISQLVDNKDAGDYKTPAGVYGCLRDLLANNLVTRRKSDHKREKYEYKWRDVGNKAIIIRMPNSIKEKNNE
jgi:predicted transcriptional regulator